MKKKNLPKESTPFWRTTLNALNGIGLGLESERSLRLHFVAMFLVSTLGLMLQISLIEWGILFLTFALLTGLELANTAIETLADFIHPDVHPAVKRLKDIAAGSVFVAAIFAVAIGIVVFFPKIFVNL